MTSSAISIKSLLNVCLYRYFQDLRQRKENQHVGCRNVLAKVAGLALSELVSQYQTQTLHFMAGPLIQGIQISF